jgi:CCR4-NOT transcriptional regulation complex NOT5 subunit
MSDPLEELRKASQKAVQLTNQQLADKIAQFKEPEITVILTALENSAVDPVTVAGLQQKIEQATNKNKIILDVVAKGGTIGKTLLDIITKIV